MKVVFKNAKSIPAALSVNSSASPSIKGEFPGHELDLALSVPNLKNGRTTRTFEKHEVVLT